MASSRSFAHATHCTQLQASQFYDVGYIAIDVASLLFLVMFVPSSFLLPSIIRFAGHGATMYIASLATVGGAWLRIASHSYTTVIIGQGLAAIGQPIIFANIPALSQGACDPCTRFLRLALQ